MSQLAVWKKKFLSFNQAIAGPCICHNLYHNPPPSGEDELVKGPSKVLTEGNNISIPSLAVTRAQISTPALAPTPKSTKELCLQLLKNYAVTVKLLEQNHMSSLYKQLFKAQFSDLYYDKL